VDRLLTPSNAHWLRRNSVLALGLGGLAVLAAASQVALASAAGVVIPPAKRVVGRTYAQWEVAYWRWSLRFHRHDSPQGNPAAACALGQRGNVWFLGGNISNSTTVRRTCTLPAGTFIFIGNPSVECSTVEKPPFHGSTPAQLKSCAHNDWFSPGTPHTSVSVDGKVLAPTMFTVSTAAFSFTMPATDNTLDLPGVSHGLAAVVGSALMLSPLGSGHHTLRLAGTNGTSGSDTYRLSVR
jgi:hypothetical protein